MQLTEQILSRLTGGDVVTRLNALAQLDYDATQAYEQALTHIDSPEIHVKISQFKADHARHIEELAELVRGLGGKPIECKADLKGFLIEKFTSVRSLTGTVGALKAMDTNEMLTNAVYKAVLSTDLPDNARDLVEKNYADEQRHLKFIQKKLDNRGWEQRVPAPEKKAG